MSGSRRGKRWSPGRALGHREVPRSAPRARSANRSGRCFFAFADKTRTAARDPFRVTAADEWSTAKRYAALALEPPLGFVSPPLDVLLSDDDFLLSSLFELLESLESVFAGDFASLDVDLDSLLEGLAEP